MIDIITHIPDLELFRAECKSLAESGNEFFIYDEKTQTLSYNISQIPVTYSADFTQSICLIRLTTDAEQETFDALTTCNRIGLCINDVYVFDTQLDEDICKSICVKPPVKITDENGEVSYYTYPETPGLFA